MRECNNIKIHISSNFLLSISLIIMLDTILLGLSLHCNTSLHFKLHFTKIIDTSLPLNTSLPIYNTAGYARLKLIDCLYIFHHWCR